MPNPCRSASEILGGGLALAIVALIAVSSAHIARPQASLPATPLHYASTAIESSEEAAKLSLSELDQSAAGTARAHNAQSSGSGSNGTATLEPVVPVRASSPSFPLAAVPAAPPTKWGRGAGRGVEDAARIRRRLLDAEPPPRRSAEAAQRARSPDPPSAPRLADIRSHNTPAPAHVRAAQAFVGRWSDDVSRCRGGRETPLVISSRAAKTQNGECDFGTVARERENQWRVAAICTSEGEFWRANIALKLVEPTLTWSSERGTETYVRCKH